MFATACALPTVARAEEPLTQRYTFAGNADFFATGGALAIDGPDNDTTMVDTALHPGTTTISANDLPDDPSLRRAFLYWGGSIPEAACDGSQTDTTVTFTAPNQGPVAVVAQACYCSEAGALSYDIQLCRADVTDLIDALDGEYAVDDFAAQINNSATANASFSIVLVFSANSLPARRIAIYDGLLTMWNQSTASETVVLDQIEIDDPPRGDLTWYALEGDIGGGGDEGVSVVGQPGGLGLDLFDMLNPVDNPMNHTINTTSPPQTDVLGVDIDKFAIDAALTAADTSVETTYRGGGDKYWIAYNVVGVNIYSPDFSEASTKTWTLQDDADRSGGPSPGDTIRYSIHVENTGDVAGVVRVDDTMPAQVASWELVDDGGGTPDLADPDKLAITDIALGIGESTDIVFDVVIADATQGMDMINVASYDAPPDGGGGPLEAAPVPIASGPAPGDGDGDPTTGDGDGDPTTGDGDPGTSGDESGEDSGDTTNSGGDTATSGDELGGGELGGEGCSCATGGATGNGGGSGGPLSLLGLALLGLGLTRGRGSRASR